MSDGRLIAGIGAGDSQSRAENEAFGLEFGTMVDRVSALHDAVRAAEDGDYPVWVGGRAAQVREIVALADGWNRWGGTPSEFARRRRARARGRARRDDHVGRARADRRRRRGRRGQGGTALRSRTTCSSAARRASPSSSTRSCERGAEWVILGPIDSTDPHERGRARRGPQAAEQLAPRRRSAPADEGEPADREGGDEADEHARVRAGRGGRARSRDRRSRRRTGTPRSSRWSATAVGAVRAWR